MVSIPDDEVKSSYAQPEAHQRDEVGEHVPVRKGHQGQQILVERIPRETRRNVDPRFHKLSGNDHTPYRVPVHAVIDQQTGQRQSRYRQAEQNPSKSVVRCLYNNFVSGPSCIEAINDVTSLR